LRPKAFSAGASGGKHLQVGGLVINRPWWRVEQFLGLASTLMVIALVVVTLLVFLPAPHTVCPPPPFSACDLVSDPVDAGKALGLVIVWAVGRMGAGEWLGMRRALRRYEDLLDDGLLVRRIPERQRDYR
jgi:hypothetical protein